MTVQKDSILKGSQRTSPVTARPSDDERLTGTGAAGAHEHSLDREGSEARLDLGRRTDRTDGVDRLSHEDGDRNPELRPQLRRNPWEPEILANPPKIPGYHLFWATTTNQADPIQRRLQMGYVLVDAADVPGHEYLTLKSGEFTGAIACNEMILLKVPEKLYQEWMKEMHHDAPQAEEDRMKDIIDTIKENAQDSQGTPLIRDIGDGTASVGSGRAKTPHFTP